MENIKKQRKNRKGQSGKNMIWQAALYVRLSREDGDKAESDSIINQKELLTEFVRLEVDLQMYDIYVDDGWSGTNFERPEFRRMISDIKSGNVNCVIVKDLSRFGRNYIEVGEYIEKIFPMLDIRFISVTDSLDSVKNPQTMNNIIVPFKNLINDEYCRDISNKVRSSLDMKRKQGKHIGSFACYGYLKDPEDHNHLIPDPIAGEVVKDIFQWFLEGTSISGITKRLNGMGILNPTMYKRQQGYNYKHPQIGINDGLWPASSVRRILGNRMYTGVMIQGVNKIKSYKLQVVQRQPEEEWFVVEDTHTALITKETFEMVQSVLQKRTRTAPKQRQIYLFSGFLRCGDCKKAMNRKIIRQPYGTYTYFICSTYKKMDTGACTKHTIRSDKLECAVLKSIQLQIALAVDMDEAIQAINQSEHMNGEPERLKKLLKQSQSEVQKAEDMILELYPDWKAGVISKEEYEKLKIRFIQQKSEAAARVAEVTAKIQDAEGGQDEKNEFLQNFIKYRNITKLTREVLIALVDNIYIYEGGNVEIKFKYRDPFQAAAEYIEENKKEAGQNKNSLKNYFPILTLAPAACQVIVQNLKDFNRTPEDYDKIITGDLGYVGQSILLDLVKREGYDISKNHMDCGIEIYDQETQDTHAGGSGCGCSAVTLSAYILPLLEHGDWHRVLFIPTGALLSPTSFNEGQTIPGIAHGVVLEHC